jgi:hypothetical protein
MNGEKPGRAVPRTMRLPASKQVVAAVAVLLAAGALGLLIWSLAASRQLAWLTSISNVLAVDLAAWTASAGMLAWVIRSGNPAVDGIAARASRSPGLPAGPVSGTRGGQFGKKNAQVNYFIGDATRGHESWFWQGSADGAGPQGQSRAFPVRDARTQAHKLGVHQAVEVPGATDDHPAYVPRDTDCKVGGVRAAITTASRDSGFVVVVGDSSSGKTRTLLEAVITAVPDWWLLRPQNAAEIEDLAKEAPARIVVWVDNLRSYLDGDDLKEATVSTLLLGPGPVILAGTLWPEYVDEYTAVPGVGHGDPHREARGVISQATCVPLESQLSLDERARAEQLAAEDPRIREALAATDYGFTQTMAGAPQLIQRWRLAETGFPYARAVIRTAIDVTRLGARSPLREEFLRAAAPGYRSEGDRTPVPPGWFKKALDFAVASTNGAVAILRPDSPPGAAEGEVSGYLLADYLGQVAGKERAGEIPPTQFWEALLVYADPADLSALARSARDRGLYRLAARLYKRAGASLTAGDAAALLTLIHDVDPGSTQDTARWIVANADFTDPSGTGLLLHEMRRSHIPADALAAVVTQAVGRTRLHETGSVSYLVNTLPREGAEEAVLALADRIAQDVALTGKPLIYAGDLLVNLYKRGLTRAAHALAAGISDIREPGNLRFVPRLLNAMKLVGEDHAATALAKRAVEAVKAVRPEAVPRPDLLADLLDALRKAGAGTLIADLAGCESVTRADITDRFHAAELAWALRKAGAGEASTALFSRVLDATDITNPDDASALLDELRILKADGLLTDVAAHAAGRVRPQTTANLMLDLTHSGQHEAAAALAARNRPTRLDLTDTDTTDPHAVADLLWALYTIGAGDAVAELLSTRPAQHVHIDRDTLKYPNGIAYLSATLGEAGDNDAVITLARRAADALDLTDTQAVADWLSLMTAEFGAAPAFDAALLARDPARHVDLGNPAAVAELLYALRGKDADDALADLVRSIPADNTDLTSPSAVARLLDALRHTGAWPAMGRLLDRDLPEQVRLDDPVGVISLLRALHDAGSAEAVTAILNKDPVSSFNVSDPEVVNRQLSVLYGIGATGGVKAMVALNPAAHVSLDKPHLVATLMGTLRQVGADKQAESLAIRATDHGIFSSAPVATRLAFGREPDCKSSTPWGWRDLA